MNPALPGVYAAASKDGLQLPWWLLIGATCAIALLLWWRQRRLRRPALVEALLITPRLLEEQPTPELRRSLRILRRTRDIGAVWSALGLPRRRLELMEALIDPRCDKQRAMRLVAELFGMSGVDQADILVPHPGIWVMGVKLPEPEGLRDQPLAFLYLDVDALANESAAHLRRVQETVINNLGHRFENPYLLLCRDRASHDIPHELRVTRYSGLFMGEEELRTLLWSPRPGHTLAGYLLTRGLDTSLLPYATAGEVEDERMFFGRGQVLNELYQKPRHLLIGPRRIGKSSLLRRLAERTRELARMGEIEREVIYLDFMDVDDARTAAWRLVDKLGINVPAGAGGEQLFLDLLRRRYADKKRKGVILIDEFDRLARDDAQRGHRLVKGMRTLQAEGVCSFVLTGFEYLYRENLDQTSPLYNFATVRIIGPLDRASTHALVTEPMERVGVRFENKELVERIFEQTGGYPSVVQRLCAELLHKLDNPSLVITRAHLDRIERSRAVLGDLEASFRVNTSPAARIAMFGLLDQADFDESDVNAALIQVVARRFPFHIVEEVLRQLLLGGFILEDNSEFAKRYTWSIPLLRRALSTHSFAVKRLASELGDDPNQWLDILPRTTRQP